MTLLGKTEQDGAAKRQRARCRFQTFEEAYRHFLEVLCLEPEFENSPRGYASREVLSVTYTVAEPRERVVRDPARGTNLIFNYAEVLWYLSGGNDLSFIQYYAPRMSRYSADGVTLRGTAYGPRIFGFGGAGINQWDNVVKILQEDPDSKRAYIQIFAPEELLDSSNIDVACTLGLQYFIRDNALHAVTYMRANDAFRGAVSDVFSFTILQELMACQLGLQLGSYTHVTGSYHLYEPDGPKAERLLASSAGPVSTAAFPEMPKGDNWPAIRRVLELEAGLRAGWYTPDAVELRRLELPGYWRQVLTLLAYYAGGRQGRPVDELLGELEPPFRQLAGRLKVPSLGTTS